MGRLMRAAATASMVSSARTNRAVRKGIEAQTDAQQQQMQQPDPAQEPVQQAAPQTGGSDDLTAQLEQLAKLHEQGILTDEEFTAKKQQLLGI